VIETVVLNWSYVGGARGMTTLQPAAPLGFDSFMRWLFFLMTVLAVLAVAAARYIEISWIGRGLRALRDDEVAAESSGVPTLKMKLLAATISGALMGMRSTWDLSNPPRCSVSITPCPRWRCR
jgi:branched-chain amino acid transport system permease protein